MKNEIKQEVLSILNYYHDMVGVDKAKTKECIAEIEAIGQRPKRTNRQVEVDMKRYDVAEFKKWGMEELAQQMKDITFKSESSIKSILTACIEAYKTSYEDVNSKRRQKHIVDCRMMYAWVTRKIHGQTMSLNAIGIPIGKKDHATILHYIKQMDGFLNFDTELRDLTIEVLSSLGFHSEWSGTRMIIRQRTT